MGNFGWTIKTGDLLRHVGTEDVIDFEHKDIDNDSIRLSPPGVSGTIRLLSLNNTSIQCTINNLSCMVVDISDISGEEFTRDVYLDAYEVIFTLPQDDIDIDEIYKSYSDVYEIDPKDLCIDLSNCIANAIRSQDPVVKKKNDEEMWECENNDENDFDEVM